MYIKGDVVRFKTLDELHESGWKIEEEHADALILKKDDINDTFRFPLLENLEDERMEVVDKEVELNGVLYTPVKIIGDREDHETQWIMADVLRLRGRLLTF